MKINLKFEQNLKCLQKMQLENQTIQTLIRLLGSQSGFSLFAQDYLSENEGKYLYTILSKQCKPRADGPGSALFAIESTTFGSISLCSNNLNMSKL